MAFDVSPASGVRSQVNITPLIDVVLVLLIIFMVMIPTTMKHMKPVVAQESAAVAPPGPAPVTVKLGAAGDLAIDGQPTTWEQLPASLRRRLTDVRQSTVYFDIADDAGYGDAVRLMDTCRGVGAQTLAVRGGRAPT